jgi:hypothetical protein
MTKIYDQFDAAFRSVSSFAVLRGGEVVATVNIKFPRDGAGRLYAYVHWIGREMVRGHAGGYGYDKRTAAVAKAAKSIETFESPAEATFWAALRIDGGKHWNDQLRDAGFTVIQTI